MAYCEIIDMPDGGRVFLRMTGRRPEVCPFCIKRTHTALCDFPTGNGKTCDAPICDECRTHVGKDTDYCPRHRDAVDTQKSLFSGPQSYIEVR